MNLDNLFNLMKEKNITSLQLSKDTDISSGNISDWKKGRSMPTAPKLYLLADYLDCSVDYLLGRTKYKKNLPDKGDDDFKINSIHDNYDVIGSGSIGSNIISDNITTNTSGFDERKLSPQALELLNICKDLTIIDLAKLLIYANDLKEKDEEKIRNSKN